MTELPGILQPTGEPTLLGLLTGAIENLFGVWSERGMIGQPNFIRAKRFYERAARRGLAVAKGNLGLLYLNGAGVKRDASIAFELLKAAAVEGVSWAQNHLGAMYSEGNEIKQDPAEALHWYRRAAEQGYAPAQFNVGWVLECGVGVPVDETEASEWYRKAAKAGVAYAQYNLALMYRDGRGLDRDFEAARKWLSRATKSGLHDVAEELDDLQRRIEHPELRVVSVQNKEISSGKDR